MSLSAQNSITVKRLRTGDTLFLTIENNGVPLYQAVDSVTGVVTPSWGTGDGQQTPILTPKVTSALGNVVTLSGHSWSYNGTALTFSGEVVTIGGVSYAKAAENASLAMNADTGALAVVGDLAGLDNMASDTLVYEGTATCAGVEYQMTRSVDIQIQDGGASAYYGTINASTEQLTASVTTSSLATHLYLGGTEVTGYAVKWYKDDELMSDKSGPTITVGKSDVDGTQLFVAEFYKTAEDTNPVFRAGVRIIDTNDDYQVQHRYVNVASDGTVSQSSSASPARREVDTGKPVYLQAYLVNVRTNAEMTGLSNAKWVSNVMDKDTWTSLKRFPETGTNSGDTNLVTVTTAETDVDGAYKDVEIVSEVTFDL